MWHHQVNINALVSNTYLPNNQMTFCFPQMSYFILLSTFFIHSFNLQWRHEAERNGASLTSGRFQAWWQIKLPSESDVIGNLL